MAWRIKKRKSGNFGKHTGPETCTLIIHSFSFGTLTYLPSKPPLVACPFSSTPSPILFANVPIDLAYVRWRF